MKILTILVVLILLATAGSGYAQFRDLSKNMMEDQDKPITLRLTPEMFSEQVSMHEFHPHSNRSSQFPVSKTPYRLIQLATDLLGNRLDIDFSTPSYIVYPKTVSEYKNAVRRQMFDPETTSQQRRSPTLFRFN